MQFNRKINRSCFTVDFWVPGANHGEHHGVFSVQTVHHVKNNLVFCYSKYPYQSTESKYFCYVWKYTHTHTHTNEPCDQALKSSCCSTFGFSCYFVARHEWELPFIKAHKALKTCKTSFEALRFSSGSEGEEEWKKKKSNREQIEGGCFQTASQNLLLRRLISVMKYEHVIAGGPLARTHESHLPWWGLIWLLFGKQHIIWSYRSKD